MIWKTVVLICAVMIVKCDRGRRDPRLFSFNYEERDISVDLDFSIPFIRIPVKKTFDSLGGYGEFPVININPASLALGGAVVLGTTVILPLLMKNYISQSDYRYSRVLDNTQFGAESVISFANSVLSDAGSLRGCTQRIACWAAQRQDPDMTNIVYRISDNRLLSSFINTTSVEDAVLSGRNGRECTTYQPCPLQENYIPVLLNNLSILSGSLKTT